MSKESVSGIKEDQLEKKGRASLEEAFGGQQKEIETKEPDTPDEPKQAQQQSDEPAQDAIDSELSKYDNILVNTFGYDETEISDKDRKIAKSWAEIQSTATKSKQEAQQHKQYLEQLNGVLGQHPSLYKKLEQALNGQYQENPVKEEPKGQSQPNKGQLDYDDISEDKLVSEGYLSQDELNGLDDLAKMRKVMRAEAKYIREQERDNYLNDIKNGQETLRKQQEAQTIKQENEQRATQGFDQFVTKYGVNFAELDDSVMQQIQKRMLVTLDPEDPRKIAEDAFEVAASRVLPQHGVSLQQKVQPSGKSVDQIQDSGKTFSKATKQQSKKDISSQLRERAIKHAAGSMNPKDKFKQQYGNVL